MAGAGDRAPSTNIRNLNPNLESLDAIINSDELTITARETPENPTGKVIRTIAGFNADAQQAINDVQASGAATIAEIEELAQVAVDGVGYDYLDPLTFETGATITNANQALLWAAADGGNDSYYRWAGALPKTVPSGSTPADSGGVATGAWRFLGDAALRSELANPDKGAAMVARGVVAVDSIADLLALPEHQRREDLRYLVKEYHAGTGVGGGEFYWDALSTETENGGTVFGNYANGRWLRVIRDELLATYFGAIPDADPSAFTGTDNSDVQLAVDEYAYQAGYTTVLWPEGAYRFTQPLQRKVAHYGRLYNEYISPSVTFILDNPSPTTWLTGKGVDPNPWRSHDIRNISFISAQDKIHTLFDANGYRLLIENCTFRRFDVVFDVDGVYVWWKNCQFFSSNTAIYPRALRHSGLQSTMFSFDHCVFLGCNIGFHFENRGLGNEDLHNELMSLQFNNCGFEQGFDSGIKIEEKVWYLTTTNCWSEQNGVAGVNLIARGTDWVDVGSRWEDAVIDQTLHGALRVRPNVFTFGTVHHPFRTHRVKGVLSSTIHIKNDGEIRWSDFPATASVDSGVFTVDFPITISRPVVSVTPCTRFNSLSYSIRLDNTVDPSSVGVFASINRIEIRFFNPDDPSTLITPAWCALSISWPSGDNAPNPEP